MADVSRLIVRQIPHLRRYARALQGDCAVADDLVQDCLERAWSRLHTWRQGSDMRAWLFTIMHNVHANRVRSERRRPRLVALDDDIPVGTAPPTQEDGIVLRDLANALAALPEEQRAAVLLVGLEEFSYAQAAAVLDVPVGTLMSRLSRGRARLRRLVSDEDGTELKTVKQP